ncbi:hypothetical protein KPH14_010463 [Odynerus spinipes]|uniref:Uncharacterized protein n=1 Tax=Odynerus spinipes TaxID=1348599 RepID=A0AAD9RTY6_9HYME|nr:hypothetical protein KPH14_010463 [Odynerus spinipes]
MVFTNIDGSAIKGPYQEIKKGKDTHMSSGSGQRTQYQHNSSEKNDKKYGAWGAKSVFQKRRTEERKRRREEEKKKGSVFGDTERESFETKLLGETRRNETRRRYFGAETYRFIADELRQERILKANF